MAMKKKPTTIVNIDADIKANRKVAYAYPKGRPISVNIRKNITYIEIIRNVFLSRFIVLFLLLLISYLYHMGLSRLCDLYYSLIINSHIFDPLF